MSDPTNPATPQPRRRRLAISVRVMMALVLVIGLPMGWKARRASIQRRAIAEVKRAGGDVVFDYELEANRTGADSNPPGPVWLRSLIGDEYFREVTEAWLHPGNGNTDEAMPPPQDFDAVMDSFAEFDQVREVNLLNGWVTKAGLARLGTLSHLRLLQLEIKGLHDEDLAAIRGLTSLETLAIRSIPDGDDGFTGASLAHLAGLTRLTGLKIEGIKADGIGTRRFLAGMTSLELLELEQSPRDDSWLEQIRGLARIKELYLGSTEITDAGMRSLAALDSLTTIRFAGGKLTDGGLAEIARNASLDHVEIDHLTRATDAGVAKLLRLPGLFDLSLRGASIDGSFLSALPSGLNHVRFDLVGSGVTDAGLASIPAGSRIQRLNLGGTKVTEGGLTHLARLGRLEKLGLAGIHLSRASLAGLGKISGLWELNLSGTGITDTDLPALSALSDLRVLFLYDTEVTPGGVESFRRERPSKPFVFLDRDRAHRLRGSSASPIVTDPSPDAPPR